MSLAILAAGLVMAESGSGAPVTDAQAYQALATVTNRMDSGLPTDWDGAGALLRAAVRQRSNDPDAQQMLEQYLYLYEGHHPLAGSARAWAAAAAAGNAELAAWGSKKAAFFALAKQPVDLAFTAADGRQVDLRALRGKVVLIDFWATWCGPCIEELPFVKSAYRQYHAQGFEIVGVSCDVSPSRQPDATWTRTAAQVVAFARAQEMPWPQQYEGRKHGAGGNALAERFAVNFIPESFLLGPDGRIAAMGLRGFALAEAVGRLVAALPAQHSG